MQRFVQTPACSLYTGLAVGDTTMRITPYPLDLDGNKLTMTDFGSTPTATIDPKVSGFEEVVSFTGIVDNLDGTATLTGLVRDLTSKYPYTTPGTGKLHGSSAVVVFSDNPQVYNRLASKENDETITGSWQFPAPTLPASPVRLSDLNGVVAGTVPSASTTSQGSTKLSQAPSLSLGVATITIASPGVVSNTGHGLIAGDQVKFTTTGALPTGLAAGTVYYVIAAGLTANAFELATTLAGTAINTTGSQSGVHTLFRVTPVAVVDNDSRIFPNAYGVDAGGTDAYAITLATPPAAYVTGQVFAFKANTVNTGPATLNVNGLGAKTIKKDGTNDLADGDIAAGKVVMVLYDGTNFQMQTRTGAPISTRTIITASGTYTLPAGCRYVDVEIGGASGGGGGGGSGSWAGAGGGAYLLKRLLAAAVGSPVTVTIGAAGASDGGTGGTTSFGASLSVTGATGGTTTGAGVGTSGTATGGDLNLNGQQGTPGVGTNIGGPGGFGLLGRIGGAGCGSAGTCHGAAGLPGIIVVTEYY